jgi:hypothetical protein
MIPRGYHRLALVFPSTVREPPGVIFVLLIEFLAEQDVDWMRSRANDFHCPIHEPVGTRSTASHYFRRAGQRVYGGVKGSTEDVGLHFERFGRSHDSRDSRDGVESVPTLVMATELFKKEQAFHARSELRSPDPAVHRGGRRVFPDTDTMDQWFCHFIPARYPKGLFS